MEMSHQFFENKACKSYPCHQGTEHINCLFCFCPMYHFKNCLGRPEYKQKDGKNIKVCTNCSFPHIPENYDKIMQFLKENR